MSRNLWASGAIIEYQPNQSLANFSKIFTTTLSWHCPCSARDRPETLPGVSSHQILLTPEISR
jgi:hypothetical protein